MTRKELSTLLKQFRFRRGLTQEQAAGELGISRRTLIAFELGYKRQPRPLTLARISMNMKRLEEAA